MNKLSKFLFIGLYVVVILTIYFTSATLSKYISNTTFKGSFIIEDSLYFEYTRGNLYLNESLIQGNEIIDTQYNDDGDIISTKKRIEFENVSPSDKIQYTFFVSNLSTEGIEHNGIDGYFVVTAYGMLSLPVLQVTDQIECTISYRQVSGANPTTIYTDFTNGSTTNLPVYENDLETKYEFQLTIFVSDQATSTDNDDYVDATLSVYIFIDATND